MQFDLENENKRLQRQKKKKKSGFIQCPGLLLVVCYPCFFPLPLFESQMHFQLTNYTRKKLQTGSISRGAAGKGQVQENLPLSQKSQQKLWRRDGGRLLPTSHGAVGWECPDLQRQLGECIKEHWSQVTCLCIPLGVPVPIATSFSQGCSQHPVYRLL